MNDLHYEGPIVLVILDGVGLRQDDYGNAVSKSHTEFIDQLFEKYPLATLNASGESVGILKGQMGNSEVGHNALGSGQIIKQGIAKIEDEFSKGLIWQSDAWQKAIQNVKKNHSTLHFSGIFSDGGVHSSLDHLLKMLHQAEEEGVESVRIHLVLDGRDVAPKSADHYIEILESEIQKIQNVSKIPLNYRIASGGGRMVFIADRYESDWGIVEKGWNALVHGQAEHYFTDAKQAIFDIRKKDPSLQDQYFPSFVIVEQKPDGIPDRSKPVGLVKDGDSFVYYDFRADRAIEITRAFTDKDFPHFDRKTEQNYPLDIVFVGMTEYDSDKHLPENCLVSPVKIKDTLHELLGKHHISQLAVAETVKFGHITYYFNGNSYKKAENEEFLEVKSDTKPFNERPWMKAAEITDAVLDEISHDPHNELSLDEVLDEILSPASPSSPKPPKPPKYQFIRINYAGGDMVGHFGELEPTITAMEAIDLQLARLAKRLDELGGMMIITADHGNAEEVYDPITKQPKTSHTTNPVPCWFYDNTNNKNRYHFKVLKNASLANLAATIVRLFNIKDLPDSWQESLID